MVKSSRIICCGVYNVHRTEEKFIESLCWKIWSQDYFEDKVIDGRLILKRMFIIVWGNWLDLCGSECAPVSAPVITVMDLWVPWNAVNLLTSWTTVSFSSGTLLHGHSLYSMLFSELPVMYVLFKFTEHTRPENEIIEILTPEIVEKLKTMIETKLGYVEIEVIKSALKL